MIESLSLQQIIDRYNSDDVADTNRLRISNETFSTEIISEAYLGWSCFKDSKLIDLKFISANFESSRFQDCEFQNCTFEKTIFQDVTFENCTLINCKIKDSDLSHADFTGIIFNNCLFERINEGSLVKSWFESCEFINTSFNIPTTNAIATIQAVVADSKFSNSEFDQSIEFTGEFFLIHILYSESGINGMFSL